MGLGNDRDRNIRKVLNSLAPNPEAESEGIRGDLIAAVWGWGSAFPTGDGQLWYGRQFWRTDLRAGFVYGGASVGWKQVDTQVAASGPALVGSSWDGQGALQVRVGHEVVTASPLGSGNAGFNISAFPNGLLHCQIQLVESAAAVAKVHYSGSNASTRPPSTRSRIEMHLELHGGADVAASSFHRLTYYAIGW